MRNRPKLFALPLIVLLAAMSVGAIRAYAQNGNPFACPQQGWGINEYCLWAQWCFWPWMCTPIPCAPGRCSYVYPNVAAQCNFVGCYNPFPSTSYSYCF